MPSQTFGGCQAHNAWGPEPMMRHGWSELLVTTFFAANIMRLHVHIISITIGELANSPAPVKHAARWQRKHATADVRWHPHLLCQQDAVREARQVQLPTDLAELRIPALRVLDFAEPVLAVDVRGARDVLEGAFVLWRALPHSHQCSTRAVEALLDLEVSKGLPLQGG